MELKQINEEQFDIGRCAIMRVPSWDGSSDLFAALEHIGTTEGPVEPEPNSEFSALTIEVLGPAILKEYLSGESPSFELGLFPDPEKMALFSPSGTASMGTMRRRRVQTHTLWIVAEDLFLEYDATGKAVEVPITYTGGVFLKNGEALSVEDQRHVDMSLLIWKARFGRMMPRYDHADGGKSLKTVPVQVHQDLTKPDGCQLVLVLSELEDYEYDIDLEGSGS